MVPQLPGSRLLLGGGRLLIELVHGLQIGLKFHLVGFRLGCNLPDIGHWIRLLGLRTTTPVEFEAANNYESPARLNYVGIKVCWGGSSRASREWHEVALLAAITELWRSVTPSHGFELTPEANVPGALGLPSSLIEGRRL